MADDPILDDEPEDRLGMSPEQGEWRREYTRGYGDQDENGTDLSQLRENLRLTPTERLRKHQKGLRLMLEVRRAARRAGLLPTDPRPPW
jgi:hypothetical protein